MNGIHRFGAFPKDLKEMMAAGNRAERRAQGKQKRSADSAAKYEMSDKAKHMGQDAIKEYQKKAAGLSMEENKKTEEKTELSKAAQDLLAQLKEKYGNIDFFVAEFSTDEEAQYYHNQSTKQYSCVIDPQTLEEMAADEAVKEKYVGIIDTADEKFDQLKEDLGEDAGQIKRMGVTVDKEGVVTYFAELTRQTARNQEAMREQQKTKKEAEKERAEKAEKKRAERQHPGKTENGKGTESVNPFKVTAPTMESLTEKLKQLLAGRKAGNGEAAQKEKEQERPHFDMTM